MTDAKKPGTLRTATTALLQRLQFLNQAGITFLGKRDLYNALGYERNLVPRDYRERYMRGGVAGRVVEVFPKATWRGGGYVYEDESPDVDTALELAWQALDARLKIWNMFQRLDIVAGKGRYGVMLLGAAGEMNTPLPRGNRPEDLLYLSVFNEEDAAVHEWETDHQSPRFAWPKFYTLKRIDVASSSFAKPVHWTRIIHVADNITDNDVFGQPRLDRVWNLLDDLEKVTGGGAEAFWLRANQGLNVNVDKDADLSAEDEAALSDEVDEYAHNIRRVMRTRAVEVNTLGSEVADFKGPAEAILSQIAGAIGIPMRMLVGSERGELASSTDRDNWNTQVADRRQGFAEQHVVRPFVDRLIEFNYLPKPAAPYNVNWPPTTDMTETEQVDRAEKLAKLNTYFPGQTVIQPNEVRETVGYEALPELDADNIDAPDEDEQIEQLAAALRKGGVMNLVVK